MPFETLRALPDEALLAALRVLYRPGAPPVEEAALCAALRGREVAAPVPGGLLWLDLGDWTSLLVVRLGGWEPHLRALCARLLRPGETALDVGAHCGAYTSTNRNQRGPRCPNLFPSLRPTAAPSTSASGSCRSSSGSPS